MTQRRPWIRFGGFWLPASRANCVWLMKPAPRVLAKADNVGW
jgi:hypothetical protein